MMRQAFFLLNIFVFFNLHADDKKLPSPVTRSCFEHLFALTHQNGKPLDFTTLPHATFKDKTSLTESEYKFFIKNTQTTAFLRAHLSNNQQWFASHAAGDQPRQEMDKEFDKHRSFLGFGAKPFEVQPDAYSVCRYYQLSPLGKTHYTCEIDIEVDAIKRLYEEWLEKEQRKKETAQKQNSFEQFKQYFTGWIN